MKTIFTFIVIIYFLSISSVKAQHQAYSWGSYQYGQLGNGMTNCEPRMTIPNGNWKQIEITSGGQYAIAIKHDGTLWGWGNNTGYELGDGTTINRPWPIQIGTDNDWDFISICSPVFTWGNVIGIKKDGSLWGWGENDKFQLINNLDYFLKTPTNLDKGNDWIDVSNAPSYTLAVKNDGTLWAWGWNYLELLGKYNYEDDGYFKNPIQIGTDDDWERVICDYEKIYALKKDKSLWVWGLSRGDLGIEIDSYEVVLTPTRVNSDTDWMQIVTYGITFAIKENGSLWAWGSDNYNGILGTGDSLDNLKEYITPIQIGNDFDWKKISIGGYHVMAIKEDGSLWAWGVNTECQFGDGESNIQFEPKQILKDNLWADVVCAHDFTLALSDNGDLWAWGYENEFGNAFGDDIARHIAEPKPIEFPQKWNMVKSGYNYSIALEEDGSLWAWGHNLVGQYGNGTTHHSAIPKHINFGYDNSFISCGLGQTFVIKEDGSLWASGENIDGQLGDGTKIHKYELTMIGYDYDWKSVDCFYLHTVGIKEGGTIWAWGENRNAQLGLGSTEVVLSPVQIGNDNNWKTVKSGWEHSLAIKEDGTLWACGKNEHGLLGLDSLRDIYYPTQIGMENDWKFIVCGDRSSYAIKEDGTLWAWGDNRHGKLGDGTDTTRLKPTQIGTDKNWKDLSYGMQHVVALKEDGTMWAWGYNNKGQLGDNTYEKRFSPVQIGHGKKWHQVACGGEHTIALGEVITSVEELNNNINNTILIHPNPATEYIEITVTINPTVNRRVDVGLEIRIFNTLGECVKNLTPTLSEGEGVRIDISHLPRGVYYLRIGNRTRMFVKV